MADLEPGVVLSPSTVAAMERLSTSPRTAMTDQYKATTYEQWERQERRARLHALDDQDAPCLLELRDRVAALESAQQLRTFTAEEVASVVVPTVKESLTGPAGSLVDRIATDAELCQLYDAPEHGFGPALRAVYDLGRRHGAAPIRSGPESPLVERVADAIAAQATSAGIVNDRPARAAILEVAKWMRTQDDLLLCYGLDWATRVEQEAN